MALPALSDSQALDRIARLLGKSERWDSSYLEEIAYLIGRTTRTHPGDADQPYQLYKVQWPAEWKREGEHLASRENPDESAAFWSRDDEHFIDLFDVGVEAGSKRVARAQFIGYHTSGATLIATEGREHFVHRPSLIMDLIAMARTIWPEA